MNKKKSIIDEYKALSPMLKASIWFVFCSFLQKGINSISLPIFTRLLSTSEYGQCDVFFSWLSIVSEIVSLQLFSGVYLQGLVKFDDRRKEFASSIQGLSFILVCGWTVIYLIFRNFWNELFHLTTVQMLAMLILIWTSSTFNLWAGEQRVLYKYRRLVIVTLIVSFLEPLVGVVFVILAEDKVTARILSIALVDFISYSLLFFIQLFRGKKFYSSFFWKYALAFNIPLLPHYLSQHILNSADRIMINHYSGSSEAGIYGLAYSVSLIMKFFNTALSFTITPYIYQKIKEKRVEDISRLAYIALPCIAAVNIILIIFAPEIVRIFAPESYYDAIWVIPPIAMSVYFTFAYDFFAKFSLFFEKTKFVMIASLSGAILNIILNGIFIPIFGYKAAGYTTLFCYIIYTSAHYLGMKMVCKLYLNNVKPYNMRVIILISILFISVGFGIMGTYKIQIVRYIIATISLIICIFFRKQILSHVRQLLNSYKKK